MNKFNEKVKVLCESYEIKEDYDDNNEKKVFMEGVAITFEKPTRNRVSYTTQSGFDKHKTLVGKPFLDSHIDKSINTHPPFGHVVECWTGKNPKNGLPCLFYKVDIDPKKEDFIRQVRRGDISGTSIQVLVDSVIEKMDEFGEYIQANIREFLELSAVLIPGDGDTTMRLVESYNSLKEDLDTSNGNAVFNTDGVLPKRKVIRKDPESEEIKEEGCGEKSKIFEPNPIPTDSDDSNTRLISKKMDEEKNKKNEDNSYEERFTKIESMLEKLLSKESLEEGQPEDDKKGKLSGKEKDTENVSKKAMESFADVVRTVLKEELKGSPERDKGYVKKQDGPENTSGLPLTEQPANGVAPSGGDLISKDNKSVDAENDAKSKAKKPKKDYDKPTVQKNSMDEARRLIEKAKSIMQNLAESDNFVREDEDGEKPTKEPKKMDGSAPNKTKGSGFNESYKDIKDEIGKESTGRKSMVGEPAKEQLNTKTNTMNTVKEYLSKLNIRV